MVSATGGRAAHCGPPDLTSLMFTLGQRSIARQLKLATLMTVYVDSTAKATATGIHLCPYRLRSGGTNAVGLAVATASAEMCRLTRRTPSRLAVWHWPQITAKVNAWSPN